jgi:hypothetical protein
MHRFDHWREAIQGAADGEAVARVMHDYTTVIPAAVVAALPPECQKALADQDIQGAAITLLHCELTYTGEPAVAQLLHEIAHTYAAASMRIARLAKEPLSAQGR